MGSNSKPKLSKSKQITIQQEEVENLRNLQKLVVLRYSVWLGKKLLLSQKMKECKRELQKIRKLKAEIKEIYKRVEEEGRLDVNKLREIRKQYSNILEDYKRKSKPYDTKIKQLNKQIKYMDMLIINNPAVKPYVTTITELSKIPSELRVPQGGK